MPSSVRGSFAGTAATFQQSQSSMPLLFGAALVTIYIVLGVLYESLIHPLTILSTLFSASVGAALALWLFDTQFTIIAAIGVPEVWHYENDEWRILGLQREKYINRESSA